MIDRLLYNSLMYYTAENVEKKKEVTSAWV
jgi:hypothetical protein